MQTIGFQEALEKILAQDNRYHAEAYAFLRDALDSTIKRRKKNRKESAATHVSAVELLDGFRLHALQEFGPMAVTVLSYWGVRQTEDVGHMVFNLVNAGVFGKTDEDTLENFRNVYQFEDVFLRPFRPGTENLSNPGPGIVGKKT